MKLIQIKYNYLKMRYSIVIYNMYCVLFDFSLHNHAVLILQSFVFFSFLQLLKMFETADFGEGR